MTKKLLGSTLVLLGVFFCTSVSANAIAYVTPHHPEIDPSLAVSAFALLAGSLAVLRVRQKK